jgi:hypothetical protein
MDESGTLPFLLSKAFHAPQALPDPLDDTTGEVA